MTIHDTVAAETEARLEMLNDQLDTARQMLARAEKFETDNPDADWECVCASLEDTISSLEYDIATIDDWSAERYDDIRADKADHDRDARLMGDY